MPKSKNRRKNGKKGTRYIQAEALLSDVRRRIKRGEKLTYEDVKGSAANVVLEQERQARAAGRAYGRIFMLADEDNWTESAIRGELTAQRLADTMRQQDFKDVCDHLVFGYCCFTQYEFDDEETIRSAIREAGFALMQVNRARRHGWAVQESDLLKIREGLAYAQECARQVAKVDRAIAHRIMRYLDPASKERTEETDEHLSRLILGKEYADIVDAQFDEDVAAGFNKLLPPVKEGAIKKNTQLELSLQ